MPSIPVAATCDTMSAMAKKKSQNKKHKFKYAEPTGLMAGAGSKSQSVGAVPTGEVSTLKVARAGAVVSSGRDFSYVGRDVRRIGIYAVSLVALEVLLWFLFGHTGLGATVYNLVQV